MAQSRVISFKPFAWLLKTITVWHFAIWIVLSLVIVSRAAAHDMEIGHGTAFAFAMAAIALAYSILALIFGQIFGDKYRFDQIWLVSLALGIAVSAVFVLWVSIIDNEATRGFLVTAFAMFSLFLGAVLNLFLYVMPRVVSWGAYTFPKLPWGVVN